MYNQIIEFSFRATCSIQRRFLAFTTKNIRLIEVPMTLFRKDFIKKTHDLPEGYKLRQFTDTDILKFHKLMFRSKMGYCSLRYWKNFILPGGFFIVEHVKSKKVVGALFAAKDPVSLGEDTGTMGFLATDPEHREKKIASVLAFQTASRLLNEGFGTNVIYPYEHKQEVIGMYLRHGWKKG